MGDPRAPAASRTQRRLRELSPLELHGILRLRSDVFVVEQQCAYADIDGCDAETGTAACPDGSMTPE